LDRNGLSFSSCVEYILDSESLFVHEDPCSSIPLTFAQCYYMVNQPWVCREGSIGACVADDAVGVEFTSFASRWSV
jgi:hypothetical protein